MDPDRILTFTPVNHPDPKVRQVGFRLDDPYVEQCWSAIVGPSGTLLLRRMPVLWEDGAPAEIAASELSRSVGLGRGTGTAGRFAATLRRLAAFRLVCPIGASADHFEVIIEMAPLTPGQLARVPEWTRATHERLLGAHLDGLAVQSRREATIASITARLDRLQHATRRVDQPATGLGRSISR